MTSLEASSPRQSAKREAEQPIRLSSPAFADGARIPERYTADGENSPPVLTWEEPPSGTQSFALVCEDPDAPSGTFVHWLVWDIPSAQRRLDERSFEPSDGDLIGQGENHFGSIGYGGPSPPAGNPHRYFFRLYALDSRLNLESGTSRGELDRAMEGHILGEGTLIGMYGRSAE